MESETEKHCPAREVLHSVSGATGTLSFYFQAMTLTVTICRCKEPKRSGTPGSACIIDGCQADITDGLEAHTDANISSEHNLC